jgi:hypothetical protein
LPRQLDLALANLALTFSSLFRAPALVAHAAAKLGHRGAYDEREPSAESALSPAVGQA